MLLFRYKNRVYLAHIYMYILQVYVSIENTNYLFTDEKSGSKQAQNVLQHGEESEVRHY